MDLDKFEVLARLLEDGANQEPFRAKTLAPVGNVVGRRAKLIQRSRERFALGRNTVEEKLGPWMLR